MITVNGDTVTMDLADYEDLLHDRRLLEALYGAGVDNWEGFDDAMAYIGEGE